MRPLPNDDAHDPERRCIISGDRASKNALIRLALGPDNLVAPDVRARAPGRGAWIGLDREQLEVAISKGKLKGALLRAFKVSQLTIVDGLAEMTESALARVALDRMGLEAKAGNLVTGSDRISDAARKGQVHLLLHAQDAGDDGSRRLAQAMRVGSGSQGSGRTGLVLGVDRSILSQALGRENVVHIAVTDRAAANRISVALGRWHRFIGRDLGAAPCESGSQGASACGAELD